MQHAKEQLCSKRKLETRLVPRSASEDKQSNHHEALTSELVVPRDVQISAPVVPGPVLSFLWPRKKLKFWAPLYEHDNTTSSIYTHIQNITNKQLTELNACSWSLTLYSCGWSLEVLLYYSLWLYHIIYSFFSSFFCHCQKHTFLMTWSC